MTTALERDGIDGALTSCFLRTLWANSSAEERANVLARQAWRAREATVTTSRTRAAYRLTRQLRRAALQHIRDGSSFTVARTDLPDDLAVQLETAVLLLDASWKNDTWEDAW
ncbi:hypothetical protein FM076_02470 [Streptomyces albus subsp. chlorinus]|uniref:hypothetical protein n=1 Tax=Streptomyces albus TaxID=1888 RepID=UPI00156EBB44|nr:hypothetical protein [Streptomyces albus]NSC20133.1 hypothetical protein [Streptomyces albus subsp. chlorinus]